MNGLISRPDCTAFVNQHGGISYINLYESVLAFAVNLRERGVTSDSIVTVNGFDPSSSIALILAISLNGAAFVFGSPQTLKEIGLTVTHVIKSDKVKGNYHPKIFTVDSSWMKFPSGVKPNLNDFPGYDKPTNIAAYFTSSGSTGVPKLIPYTAQTVTLSHIQRSAIMPEVKVLASLFPAQYFTTIGLIFSLFLNGGTFLTFKKWHKVINHEPDLVAGSPMQLIDFLKDLPDDNVKKIPDHSNSRFIEIRFFGRGDLFPVTLFHYFLLDLFLTF